MTVAMNTFVIIDLDVKFWTQKNELPQGNFLRLLAQPEITRQRLLKLTDIKYDLIKD